MTGVHVGGYPVRGGKIGICPWHVGVSVCLYAWENSLDVLPFALLAEGSSVAASQAVHRRGAQRCLRTCHGTHVLISVPEKTNKQTSYDKACENNQR